MFLCISFVPFLNDVDKQLIKHSKVENNQMRQSKKIFKMEFRKPGTFYKFFPVNFSGAFIGRKQRKKVPLSSFILHKK